MRKGDSQLVFDVDVARSQSDENRCTTSRWRTRVSGIFRVGEIDAAGVTGVDADLSLLSLPEEQLLIKALLDYPSSLRVPPRRGAAPRRHVLHDTAGRFICGITAHVLTAGADHECRLALARAAQLVLRNGLDLLASRPRADVV